MANTQDNLEDSKLTASSKKKTTKPFLQYI